MQETPKFYTVKEFAALLRVQKNSVYRWIRRGDIKAITIRYGLVRIPASELDRLMGGAA
ncbi:MAG: helix-turn-helix domain-containing protein [Candidatus Acidiferrales bacterium]